MSQRRRGEQSAMTAKRTSANTDGGVRCRIGLALWLILFLLSAWVAQAAPSRAGLKSPAPAAGLAVARRHEPATRSSSLPATRLEHILIGEAASEGEAGMWRAACVMQARQWEVEHGFSAARRADLPAFVSRQPARVRAEAHRIVSAFFRGGDASRGGACSTADHYLTAALYDSPRCPRWATQMTVVERFRGHVFLKS